MKMWRTIAVLALGTSTLLGLGLFYLLWAFSGNLEAIRQAGVQCLQPNNKFDSIAAAEMVGRLDLVSGLLAMGGIAFAVLGFFGFHILRREVLDEAGRVALEEFRRVAQIYGIAGNEGGTYIPPQGNGPKSPPSGATKMTTKPRKSSKEAPLKPDEVSTVGAVEEKPGGNASVAAGSAGGDKKAPRARRSSAGRAAGE